MLSVKDGDTPVTDPLNLLLSDSEEEGINRIKVKNSGSCAKGVQITVQGVAAVGLVDSESDMSIMGAELFEEVAVTGRLRKRDLKPVDKVPRTYDQHTFSLNDCLDVDIEFDGKECPLPSDKKLLVNYRLYCAGS